MRTCGGNGRSSASSTRPARCELSAGPVPDRRALPGLPVRGRDEGGAGVERRGRLREEGAIAPVYRGIRYADARLPRFQPPKRAVMPPIAHAQPGDVLSSGNKRETVPFDVASEIREVAELYLAEAERHASSADTAPSLRQRVHDAVARFVRPCDTSALDHELILSLAELAGASAVSVHTCADVRGREGVMRCERAPEGGYRIVAVARTPDNPLLVLLRQGTRMGFRQQRGDGGQCLVLPMRHEGHTFGALMLESDHPLAASAMLVDGFSRIYARYLGLRQQGEPGDEP